MEKKYMVNLEPNRKEAIKQLKKEIASETHAMQRATEKSDELWAKLRVMCRHDRAFTLIPKFSVNYDMGRLWEVVCSDCGHSLAIVSDCVRKGFKEKCREDGIKVVEKENFSLSTSKVL